jgi:PAS domain S-box-containing protein
MWYLERVWAERNRRAVLLVSGSIILTVAVAGWRSGPHVSLSFLYLLPIMLAAAFLPRSLVVLLGVGCALLSAFFNPLDRSAVHLALAMLALAGCGLFVTELVRNRRLTLEGQERLKALVETSPAATMTIDERGFVEFANRAATELMAPADGKLVGVPIAAFLPDLYRALRGEEAPQGRAKKRCRGHRGNGEYFTADVCFSTFKEGSALRLAAIITDIAKEANASETFNSSFPEAHQPLPLNNREVDVLRCLVQGLTNNQIANRMKISADMVKHTVQQLFAKTNVRTRVLLVRVAIEQYRDLL